MLNVRRTLALFLLVFAGSPADAQHNPYLDQSHRILDFLKRNQLGKGECFTALGHMYRGLEALRLVEPTSTKGEAKAKDKRRRGDRSAPKYSVYSGHFDEDPTAFTPMVAENLYLASIHFAKHLRIWHQQGLLSEADKSTIATLHRVIRMAIAEALFYQTVIGPMVRDGSIDKYKGWPHQKGEPKIYRNRALVDAFNSRDKRGYPIVELNLPDVVAAMTRGDPNRRAVGSLIATLPGGEGVLDDSIFAHATPVYRARRAAEFARKYPHIVRTQYSPKFDGEFVRPEAFIEGGVQIREHHGTANLLAHNYAYIEFIDFSDPKRAPAFTSWDDLNGVNLTTLDDGITPIIDLIETEAARNTFPRYDALFNGRGRYCSGLILNCAQNAFGDPSYHPLMMDEINLSPQFHKSTRIAPKQRILSPGGLLGPESVPLIFGVEPVKAHEANLSSAALTALLHYLVSGGYDINEKRQAQVAWFIAALAKHVVLPLRPHLRDLPLYGRTDWQYWVPAPKVLPFIQKNSSGDILPEAGAYNLLLDAAVQHLFRRLKEKEIHERIRNPKVNHAPYVFDEAVAAAKEIIEEEFATGGKLSRLLTERD